MLGAIAMGVFEAVTRYFSDDETRVEDYKIHCSDAEYRIAREIDLEALRRFDKIGKNQWNLTLAKVLMEGVANLSDPNVDLNRQVARMISIGEIIEKAEERQVEYWDSYYNYIG